MKRFFTVPVFVLLFICCVTCAVSSAVAKEPPSARAVLEKAVTRIMDYIKNPGYKDPTTRSALRVEIEKEVRTVFDFEEFSMRTVGARWRTFSSAQKDAFCAAFANLLLATYLDKVDGYNGERINYTGEVSNDAKTRFEIRTVITLQGNKKIPVAYRMMAKNGSWYVYDVLVEGISLVKNYRTQFGSILTDAKPEELIARIQERATALRGKDAKK